MESSFTILIPYLRKAAQVYPVIQKVMRAHKAFYQNQEAMPIDKQRYIPATIFVSAVISAVPNNSVEKSAKPAAQIGSKVVA